MCLNVKNIHYFINLREFFGNSENELGSMPGTAALEGTARAQLKIILLIPQQLSMDRCSWFTPLLHSDQLLLSGLLYLL